MLESKAEGDLGADHRAQAVPEDREWPVQDGEEVVAHGRDRVVERAERILMDPVFSARKLHRVEVNAFRQSASPQAVLVGAASGVWEADQSQPRRRSANVQGTD